MENIGETQISYSIFFDFVLTLRETKYSPGTYDIRCHNANIFCDDVLHFVCGLRIPKYLLELPSDEVFDVTLEQQVLPLLERVTVDNDVHGNQVSPFYSARSQHFLHSYVPRDPREDREPSPDLIEIQAQIEALRADQLSLDERRSQLLLTTEPKKAKHRKHRKADKNHDSSKRRSRQKSPHPNSGQPKSQQQQQPVVATSEETNEKPDCDLPKKVSVAKHKLKKRVSFDEGPPVEISTTTTLVVNNTPADLDEVAVDLLPELQEDDLFAATSNTLEDCCGTTFLTEPTFRETSPTNKKPNKRATRKSTSPPPPSGYYKPIMADQEEPPTLPPEGDEAPVEVPKKNQTPKEPPITFRDFNHTQDFEDLVRTIVTLLSNEEQDRLREMEDWIIKNEGTWVLAEGFNAFLGKVLHDKALPSDCRIAMLRLLAYGAGQDDIVLILHMDRKDHLVMNYAQEFDRLPVLEQEALALFFANLFETNSSSEWLLYISEWTHGSMDLSNIRVTTKVAVNALLGDTPALQNYGSAIMHNLGTKEVFDDVCTELAMAILQFFQGKPPEEQVFRCMKALNKFCTIAHREVPQLVKMIGPEPSKFGGMSPRVDEFIGMINARLASVPSF